MPVVHRFDPPERFVPGTVGEPGQRTFFLQARAGTQITSVSLEKQQVQILGERVAELLDELISTDGSETMIPAMVPVAMIDTEPLDQPIEEEFRAGTITLSWDPEDERVVIEVFPVVEVEVDLPVDAAENELIDLPIEEPEPEELLLVRMPAAMARLFAARAESVVAAGPGTVPLLWWPDGRRGSPVSARQRLPAYSGLTLVQAPETEELREAQLEVLGRIMPASNHTFLARLGDSDARCVYKPSSGERPLWDFTDGTLAEREYAAWVVSDHLGWAVVPPTVLRDGPAGPGMVQLWVDAEEGVDPVDVVPEGQIPPRFLHVLDATGAHDEPVVLVHEDSEPLRRMAVFDIVTNNTDRKGGHILPMPGGHRYGVDHGVCFHSEDKLRTVLWGWAGMPLSAIEVAGVQSVLDGLEGSRAELREVLEELLTVREVDAVSRRCERLLQQGCFPMPRSGWPSIPWPPF